MINAMMIQTNTYIKKTRDTLYILKYCSSLLISHFTEHATLIVNYSSNAAHLHEHPCPPPLQTVALPPHSLLLGVNPKHSHRPLHCC